MKTMQKLMLVAFCGLALAQSGAAAESGDRVDVDSLNWLTPEEKAWVKSHPVLKNGVVDGHTPFEFIDEDGEHSGLAADYLRLIGERLGIEFEVVLADSFADLGSQIAAGGIGLSTYLPRSSKWVEVLSFSDPVISMPIAIFGRQDSPLVLSIASIEDYRLAVEKPSRAAEFLSRDLPGLKLTYVDSPGEGLIAVASGKADFFIHNVFSVEYYQRTLGLDSLKTVAATNYNFDIRFATSRDMAPLVSIIQKVIAGMSDYERKLIFDKWVNIRIEERFDWQLALAWGGAALVIVLFVFAFVLLWNRRLSHEVDARTRDLVQSKEEFRALARHMDRVREEEKSHLALEIHDELGHTLTALAMAVGRLGNIHKKSGAALAAGPSDDNQELQKVRGLVKEASHISRRIMSGLRPSVLEDLGLVAALEWLVHEFESNHGIPCAIHARDLEMELPPETGIVLFRIVQESLTNVAKHANASQARVSLVATDSELILEVWDNGEGLGHDWKTQDGSFGLLGMSERAQAQGGVFNISDNATGGTCILVRIPRAASSLSGKPYTENTTSPIA